MRRAVSTRCGTETQPLLKQNYDPPVHRISVVQEDGIEDRPIGFDRTPGIEPGVISVCPHLQTAGIEICQDRAKVLFLGEEAY